ncbi:PAS domain S-box protein [Microcella sp.]|uniref:PAS domain-containing hybrid sensor histidine kinase/response regulator n=1 Tax=Microcella sp. TaxID=1913979 RepID=UPI00391C57E9
MSAGPEDRDLLRIASSMARFGGWSVDAATGALELSGEVRAMLGLPLTDDLDVQRATELHPPEWRPVIRESLERCTSSGTPFDLELPIDTTDGERLTVRVIGEPAFAADGSVARAHGAVWDITATASQRERARSLEAQLEATLNSISDGMLFIDSEGRFTFVNDNGARILRRPAEALIGVPVLEAFPEAAGTSFVAALERTLTSHERSVVRDTYAPFDAVFEATIYPTDNGVAVYLKDVTEEEQLRLERETASRRLAEQAALIEAAKDAMIVRDLEGRITYWNRAAAALYGWSAEEAIGREERDLLHDDPAAFDAAVAHTLHDDYWSGELDQRTRSGRALIADCRWQLLRDSTGQPASIFAVVSDITADKKAEEARLRAQRMESLGTLAGGIAHDLNNVLTPILMSVQLLEHGEVDERRRQILATMEGAVKRGADMIRQVLSFARGVEGRRVEVDVRRLVSDVVSYARDVLPDSVLLDAAVDDGLPTTSGDPTQLLQILVNLVTNARDAMPGGGTLRIRVSELLLEDSYSSVSHLALPGRYVAIDIEDTGHGMSADVAEKIFEPFFTTKEMGKGTGLGLATSLAIVRSHGGFMQVYSEPGRGTRFTVGLPVSESPQTSAAVPTRLEELLPRGHGERILVVDDETTILQITCQALELNGYRTLRATNGREALDVIASSADPIDLVLTDMMMPVMDGAALSARLEDEYPELPVIAASGLNSNGGPARSVGMGVSRFLPKPYTTTMLLTTVHDTLRERGASSRVEQ